MSSSAFPVEFERNQNADAAEPIGHRAMDIARDHALADRQLGGPAQRHVLADLGNGVVDRIGGGDVADLGGEDLVHVRAGIERHVGDHLNQALEQVVAGDEVGFRIDFDHNALGALDGDADQTFGRDAAGLLGGLGQTLLAQPIDRTFEIAAGLVQRRLAIHHARAGFLAEVLHHACGDVRHCLRSLIAQVLIAQDLIS